MVLNNNGQVFFYSLMLGILVLVLALALSGPVKETVDSVRNQSTSILYTNQSTSNPGLDCTNSSISNFDKATCVISDLSLFHFIGGLIMIAGAIMTAKLIFN